MSFPVIGSIRSFDDVKKALERIRNYFSSNEPGTVRGPSKTITGQMAVFEGSTGKILKIGEIKTSWPVGSVFLSVVPTNPNTLLGFGTWVQIAQGQMLVGFKTGDPDFGIIEKTGGAKTVSHSGGAVASHTGADSQAGTGAAIKVFNGVGDLSHNVTQPSNHNILNPYLVIYVWKRTA